MAKQILFGEEARKSLQRGVDQLADTERLPWSRPQCSSR